MKLTKMNYRISPGFRLLSRSITTILASIRRNPYKKSSKGIVPIRMLVKAFSLYHTTGELIRDPVRIPLTIQKGIKQTK